MPISLYLLLCLPFVAIALLFFFYLYAVFSRDDHHSRVLIKTARKQGLSDVQLEKLPKIIGKDLRLDNDCAICLDVIGNEELARLIPGCKHGFHLECVDPWLSKQSFCPVCRHKVEPELFINQDENNLC